MAGPHLLTLEWAVTADEDPRGFVLTPRMREGYLLDVQTFSFNVWLSLSWIIIVVNH